MIEKDFYSPNFVALLFVFLDHFIVISARHNQHLLCLKSTYQYFFSRHSLGILKNFLYHCRHYYSSVTEYEYNNI